MKSTDLAGYLEEWGGFRLTHDPRICGVPGCTLVAVEMPEGHDGAFVFGKVDIHVSIAGVGMKTVERTGGIQANAFRCIAALAQLR